METYNTIIAINFGLLICLLLLVISFISFIIDIIKEKIEFERRIKRIEEFDERKRKGL